ncbi:MAG: type 3 dihydrofolate reductase [Gammaproteobacteria bacterium]
MRIAAIVAMSENRVIGKDNQLPWHLPADLAHFKEVTTGKSIIMGRKTYESIGRPLPNRNNIVVSSDTRFQAPGCLVVNSIDAALSHAHEQNEVFVIGGAHLYQQMLPRVQRLYLTIIHQEFVGDAFFPELDPCEWLEEARVDHIADSRNPYAFSFVTLVRKL